MPGIDQQYPDDFWSGCQGGQGEQATGVLEEAEGLTSSHWWR